MAYAHAALVTNGITTISDSAGTVVTNASGKTTQIRTIIMHNGNTTEEEVKLYYVPDSGGAVGTAADTNKIYDPAIKMQPGETIVWDIGTQGIVLEDTNDTLQAVTDTASKVTIMAFGGIS